MGPVEDGSCPHEAGLSNADPFSQTSGPMPKQDACHILRGHVLGARLFYIFFFLHRQGGGLRLARPSLPSDDTRGLVIALRIAISAHFRGVRHAS